MSVCASLFMHVFSPISSARSNNISYFETWIYHQSHSNTQTQPHIHTRGYLHSPKRKHKSLPPSRRFCFHQQFSGLLGTDTRNNLYQNFVGDLDHIHPYSGNSNLCTYLFIFPQGEERKKILKNWKFRKIHKCFFPLSVHWIYYVIYKLEHFTRCLHKYLSSFIWNNPEFDRLLLSVEVFCWWR